MLLPTEEKKWLKFKDYAKGLKVPFVIYADFECFPQPCSEKSEQTLKYQKHTPSGFSYVVISSNDEYSSRQAVVYRGENVMDEFFNHLERSISTNYTNSKLQVTMYSFKIEMK